MGPAAAPCRALCGRPVGYRLRAMAEGERARAMVARGAAGAPGDSTWPSRRVVAVTGAAGFLGSAIVRRLAADPRCVRLLALDVRRPRGLPTVAQYHKLDLTLPSADAELAELLSREGADTLVHASFLAAPTHNTAWAHELEAIGTMHVINAVSEARVHKLVMLSTTLLYGAHPDNPNFLTERHETRGHKRSRFISEKLEAERQVRRFAAESAAHVVTILRCAATIGPTVQNVFTRFFARPVAPVLWGYDPLLQLLHEDDLCEAVALSVEHDVPGIFNIVGDGVLPYTTVLAMMGKVPLPMPGLLAYPMSRALWVTQVFDSPPSFLDFLRFLCVADGEKARRVMGFSPRHDIRSTIADFLGVATGRGEAA